MLEERKVLRYDKTDKDGWIRDIQYQVIPTWNYIVRDPSVQKTNANLDVRDL